MWCSCGAAVVQLWCSCGAAVVQQRGHAGRGARARCTSVAGVWWAWPHATGSTHVLHLCAPARPTCTCTGALGAARQGCMVCMLGAFTGRSFGGVGVSAFWNASVPVSQAMADRSSVVPHASGGEHVAVPAGPHHWPPHRHPRDSRGLNNHFEPIKRYTFTSMHFASFKIISRDESRAGFM